MTTKAALLGEAARWVGTTESPPNSNCQPFSTHMGRPCEFWCADFVADMARRTGLTLPSASAYTPTMADGFKRVGRWHTTPESGDIVFFDWPDSKHRIQHVGIVERVADATHIVTIEGNTSSSDHGSQDNGGGVYRRTRQTSYVVGYGRPLYDPPPTQGAFMPAISDQEQRDLVQRVKNLENAQSTYVNPRLGEIDEIKALVERIVRKVGA